MNTTQLLLVRSVIFAAMLGVVGSAYAQTPTCVAPGCNSVTSDIYGNTAAGSSALLANEGASGGSNNTALGENALASNTTGFYNTASGFGALGVSGFSSSFLSSRVGGLRFNDDPSSGICKPG